MQYGVVLEAWSLGPWTTEPAATAWTATESATSRRSERSLLVEVAGIGAAKVVVTTLVTITSATLTITAITTTVTALVTVLVPA